MFRWMVPLLVAVIALFSPPLAWAQEPMMPVMPIDASCETPCKDLRVLVTAACAKCLLDTGSVTVWSNDSQPAYSLRRLPLREIGFVNTPAITMMWYPPDGQQLALVQKSAYQAYIQYPLLPKNVTICKPGKACVTRDMGPEAVIPSNTSKLGLCHTTMSWLHVPPMCDGTPDLLENITFQEPGQISKVFPTTRRMNEYEAYAADYARKMMTDVNAAADNLWLQQSPWSEAMYFVNATSKDLPMLKGWFGDVWSPKYDALLKDGKLSYMDLASWWEKIIVEIPDGMQPGSISLHELVHVDGKPRLRTLAIRLNDPIKAADRNPTPQLYTPELSESAFILANYYAGTSLAWLKPGTGHLYHMHMIGWAVSYALYNNVDPGVPINHGVHPLRQILDAYYDPRAIQEFMQLRWLQSGTPMYTGVLVEYTVQVFDFYKVHGPLPGENNWYNIHPKRMAERNGFDPAVFTSSGGEPWDLYDRMHFGQKMYKICEGHAGKLVNIFWKTDSSVKNDKPLQNFFTVLRDPKGSNFGRLNEKDKVTTKQELKEILGQLIYYVMVHKTTNMPDFFVKSMNFVAGALRVDRKDFPDPKGSYTLDQMMEYLPTARSLGLQNFLAMFLDASDSFVGTWVIPKPDGTIWWDWNLPFNRTSKWVSQNMVNKANAAAVRFRKDVGLFYYDYPTGVARDMDTNYNWPYSMQRIMDI